MQLINVKERGLDYAKWNSSILACKCERCGHSSRIMCINHGCRCCDLEDQFSLLTNVDAESIVKGRRRDNA